MTILDCLPLLRGHGCWGEKGEGLGIKYLGLGYEGDGVFSLGRRGKLWCVGVDTRPSKGRVVLPVVFILSKHQRHWL
jgi:hypothetical protein